MAGLDPLFERRLNAILTAAEKATGGKRVITEGYRSPETQAQYYADYKGTPITYGGRTYQPNPAKLGRLAALPGRSRHQIGRAADLGAGPVRDWARAHAAQFGLEILPRGIDQPHIQMARGDATGIMGPVSSTVPGTTTVPAATETAAPPTPESSVADMLSKASFGGGGGSGGGSQSAGLPSNLPPAPEFDLPIMSASAPPDAAPVAAAPDLSPLAGLFGLPTIGQPGGAVAPDGTLPGTQPGFVPGQARQPLKRLGL